VVCLQTTTQIEWWNTPRLNRAESDSFDLVYASNVFDYFEDYLAEYAALKGIKKRRPIPKSIVLVPPVEGAFSSDQAANTFNSFLILSSL